MSVFHFRAAPRPAAALVLLIAGLAALLPLCRPARAAGATYYVAATGNDSNSGSANAPFRQIRRALQAERITPFAACRIVRDRQHQIDEQRIPTDAGMTVCRGGTFAACIRSEGRSIVVRIFAY